MNFSTTRYTTSKNIQKKRWRNPRRKARLTCIVCVWVCIEEAHETRNEYIWCSIWNSNLNHKRTQYQPICNQASDLGLNREKDLNLWKKRRIGSNLETWSAKCERIVRVAAVNEINIQQIPLIKLSLEWNKNRLRCSVCELLCYRQQLHNKLSALSKEIHRIIFLRSLGW